MGAGSNGIIFDDLEWLLTRVSRSRYISKSNISKTVRPMDKVITVWYGIVEFNVPLDTV